MPPAITTSRSAPARRPSHRLAFVVALALAGLGHALAVGLVPVGPAPGWNGVPLHSLQVRQIVLPAAPVAEVALAPPPAAVPPSFVVPVPAVVEAAAAEPAAAGPAPLLVAAAAAPAPLLVAATAAPAPAVDGGGKPLTVYPTKLPPPARLGYELHHGALRGSGELVWSVDNGAYKIALEGSAFGLTLIAQQSEGRLDSAGLAPDRFLDRRRGKSVQAANFQRDAGKISFSGPPVEYPLVPGAQDRVSWMLQLCAIVAADPHRYGPGAEIAMFVVGARGEGDVWAFEVAGTEALDLPAGRVPAALRLRREPRKPYDTLNEVWLDPARAWLPVRVRQSTPQTGDSTELLLSESASR